MSEHNKERSEGVFRGNVYLYNGSVRGVSDGGKARPVLVVSNDWHNEYSGTVTVIPLTTQVKSEQATSVLYMSRESKLNAVLVGNVFSVYKDDIGHKLETLPGWVIENVEVCMRRTFGL
jgi:mRNA-degrading endonuclease toxin of MazEF toxin-antitoxin module